LDARFGHDRLSEGLADLVSLLWAQVPPKDNPRVQIGDEGVRLCFPVDVDQLFAVLRRDDKRHAHVPICRNEILKGGD